MLQGWLSLIILMSCGWIHAQEDLVDVKSLPKDLAPSVRAQLLVQLQRDKFIRQQSALSEQQVSDNKTQAQKRFAQGQSLLSEGKVKEALRSLSAAVRLDPENDSYFYAQAVAFYKVGRYRRSLAMMNVLQDSGINATEREYYEALNLYMLRESDAAFEKFSNVREQKDASLSPLAAFYAAGIARQKEDFSSARSNYEFVLDFSKDPKLDQKAEDALFSLTREQQMAEYAKVKWGYTFFTGFIYDGNVLNVSKNLEPSSAAYRGAYGGSVAYKALQSEKRSLLAQLAVSDVYSVSDQFKADSEIQSADPLVLNYSMPYRQGVTIDKQPAVLSLTPSYQQLYMSYDESGRKLIFRSAYLNTGITIPEGKKWSTDFHIEIGRDISLIENTLSDSDLTAWKTTFLLSQVRTFDQAGRNTMNLDLIFTKNRANGANNYYDKYIVSFGGTRPVGDRWNLYGRIDGIAWVFSESALQRHDMGGVLTTGAYYHLSEHSMLSFNGQYYYNYSNVEAYAYNKFVAGAMYTYHGGFF